jgi:uncharacterized protein YcfJ
MAMHLYRSAVFGSIVCGLMTVTLAGCASENERAEGTRRGAAGGALVGLTLGALTGDASLAAAGAVAGGVVGGAAGSWQDYENDRTDYRVETLADAIGGKNSGGEGEAPAGWQEIDSFVGAWRVTMWGLDGTGTRVDANANARSTLDTTQSVTFRFSDFEAGGISETVSGSTTLRFQTDRGFELLSQFSNSAEGNRYVGHFDNQSGKYVFFYAGSNQSTFSGVQRTDYRLEMQMIGGDVIVLETWATIGGEDKRIQSYRLTRTG